MASITQNNNEGSDKMSELNDLIESKDNKLSQLLERIVSETDGLEDSELTLSEKNDIITGIMFLETRLRFLVADEWCRVDFSLNKLEKNGNVPDAIRKKFNNRKNFLSNINNRLTEIRDDLSLIEKSFYYNSRLTL